MPGLFDQREATKKKKKEEEEEECYMYICIYSLIY